ncbi:MAG: hypothetical protein QNJ68_17675 [Microcoleaceae cyanobacterium MO_207.B10]|nr:hypothetical protein [Microcoleaceae cyanobacterium MO_207.B10]
MKPKLRVSQNNLEFASDKWGEKLIKTITVSNPISETILSGNWEVAPHVNDPPHTPYDHSWISFSPEKFEGNDVECKITVDTSKLVENEIYTRDIFLHSNSASKIEIMNIQVETGSLPQLKPNFMFFFVQFVLMITCMFLGYILLPLNILFILLVAGYITVYFLSNYIGKTGKKLITIGLLFIIFILVLIIASIVGKFPEILGVLIRIIMEMSLTVVVSYLIISLFLCALKQLIFAITQNKFYQSFSELDKKIIVLLTIGFYLSLGITLGIFIEFLLQLQSFTLGEILVLAGGAIACLSVTLIPLIYLLSKPIKIFSKYRKAEPNLIKP